MDSGVTEGATTLVDQGYAPVNGLSIYYEVHGQGEPLVLLHGAFSAIGSSFGAVIPALAEHFQVIGVELQGHGRTADIDRPLRYEQMADDVACLLDHLGLEGAHVLGYSLGGLTALALTIRHPERVRKLVVAGTGFHRDGSYPEVHAGITNLTPEIFEGSPIKAEYERIAPNPAGFADLVEKLKELEMNFAGFTAEQVASFPAPTLIVIGDSDGVKPEHAVEFFRLRGGGVFGDLAGMPQGQLAIVPGTSHVGLIVFSEWIVDWALPFLTGESPRNPFG